MLARAKARASIRDLSACRLRTLPVLQLGTRAAPLHFPPDRPFPWPIGAHCRSLVAQLEHFEIFFLSPRSCNSPFGQCVPGRARNAVAGLDEGQSASSARLPAISTMAVTMHPVPMDGTDGKVANERAQVGVSVVEATAT